MWLFKGFEGGSKDDYKLGVLKCVKEDLRTIIANLIFKELKVGSKDYNKMFLLDF